MRARQNPFRVDRLLEVRFRPQTMTWRDLRARLDALNHRCALVGPKGFGKTTLLEELYEQLQCDGRSVAWLKLPDGSRSETARRALSFADSLSPDTIAFLDSCEKLDWLAWHRVERRSRRAAGLIVTAHRPGRLPTLLACETSPALLRDIVQELLGDAAEIVAPLLPELFARHQGNLRDALRELYDRFARDEFVIPPAATLELAATRGCR